MEIELIRQNVFNVTLRYLESPHMWPFHRLEHQDLQKQIEYVYLAIAPAIANGYPLLEISPDGITYLLEDKSIITAG